MGRPLGIKSVSAYGFMDIQIQALEGLQALRESDRKKEAQCFKEIIAVAKLAAGKVEGLGMKPGPSPTVASKRR